MNEASEAAAEATLAGRVVAVPENRQLDVLANLLEKRGARTIRCPLVGIVDSPDEASIVAWIQRRIAAADDLIVFYTGEGIERLVACAERAGIDAAFVAALGRTPKLTRGPKPKRALRRLSLNAEFEASRPTTDGLVTAAAAIPAPNKRVAVQLYGKEQDRSLIEHFAERGIEPDCVAPYAYASAADDERVATFIAALRSERIDAIAFTSKSQVHRLFAVAAERNLVADLREGLERVCVAAVGPVVRAELEAVGVRVDAMPDDSYSMKPLVTSLASLLRAEP